MLINDHININLWSENLNFYRQSESIMAATASEAIMIELEKEGWVKNGLVGQGLTKYYMFKMWVDQKWKIPEEDEGRCQKARAE